MSFSSKEKSQRPKLVLVRSQQVEPAPSVQKPVIQNQSVAAKHLVYSKVIKTEDLRKTSDSSVRVDRFTPSEVKGKRAASIPVARQSQSRLAVEGLKQNLKTLKELQTRLRFMLTELEELVHES